MVTADGDGRFAIHDFSDFFPPNHPQPPPVSGSTLILSSLGLNGIPHDGLTQACAAAVRLDGDTEIDIELVPWGAQRLTRHTPSPSLSGMVFETPSEGRRPVRNAWVAYDSLCFLLDPDNGGTVLEISEAAQRTDVEGRYELCRLPAASVRAGACVHVSKDGLHSVHTQVVSFQGETVLDIDVTGK